MQYWCTSGWCHDLFQSWNIFFIKIIFLNVVKETVVDTKSRSSDLRVLLKTRCYRYKSWVITENCRRKVQSWIRDKNKQLIILEVRRLSIQCLSSAWRTTSSNQAIRPVRPTQVHTTNYIAVTAQKSKIIDAQKASPKPVPYGACSRSTGRTASIKF